jgi:hypothetical protein
VPPIVIRVNIVLIVLRLAPVANPCAVVLEVKYTEESRK